MEQKKNLGKSECNMMFSQIAEFSVSLLLLVFQHTRRQTS